MPADNGYNPHIKISSAEKDWISAGSQLLDMNLKSLAVECPNCGLQGIAMPKWIQGRVEKPLYVFHTDHGGPPHRCNIEPEEAKELRGKIGLSKADLRRFLKKAHAYILFSGGLDSLCTLQYLLDIAGDNKESITALHIDTTAGFPEVTKYVKSICKRLGVKLQVVSPSRDYFELAKKWGIPGFNARWCCKELKVKPVRDFLAKVTGPRVIFDGIRSDESSQRSTYLPVWYHPTFRCLSVSAILGWSRAEVAAYVESRGLPKSPAAALGCSAECWCGAYKKKSDFEKLLQVHPEIFDKLVAVEKAQKGRFTFVYEKGERVTLPALKRSLLRKNGDKSNGKSRLNGHRS